MTEKIGVTEFRSHLKDCMDSVAETPEKMYQIRSKENILLMSEETVERLEKRYYLNVRSKKALDRLKLKHLTLVNGKKTKALPLNMIIALSEFFEVVQELMDILARPGVKENAKKWDVTPYVKAAVAGGPVIMPQSKTKGKSHGRFKGVYNVVQRLFKDGCFRTDCDYTLESFFKYICEIEPTWLRSEQELTEVQKDMVASIIYYLSYWASGIIARQELSGYPDNDTDVLFVWMTPVYNWYKENIGEIPYTDSIKI